MGGGWRRDEGWKGRDRRDGERTMGGGAVMERKRKGRASKPSRFLQRAHRKQ